MIPVAVIDIWLEVEGEKKEFVMKLNDKRLIRFPHTYTDKLNAANIKDLSEVEIRLEGWALRWESLDEDLLVSKIVRNFG